MEYTHSKMSWSAETLTVKCVLADLFCTPHESNATFTRKYYSSIMYLIYATSKYYEHLNLQVKLALFIQQH